MLCKSKFIPKCRKLLQKMECGPGIKNYSTIENYSINRNHYKSFYKSKLFPPKLKTVYEKNQNCCTNRKLFKVLKGIFYFFLVNSRQKLSNSGLHFHPPFFAHFNIVFHSEIKKTMN